MKLEWDERKRRTNLAKHGIDFAELEPLFRGPISNQADRRREYGEPRSIAVGRLGEIIVSVVYTWRGSTRRIISARRADRDEREDFYRYTAADGRQGSD
jgi:uncharacterized DUF497 family protein